MHLHRHCKGKSVISKEIGSEESSTEMIAALMRLILINRCLHVNTSFEKIPKKNNNTLF